LEKKYKTTSWITDPLCKIAVHVCVGDLMKEDKILQVMPNVTLAMHVLVERKTADSFWKPYLGKFACLLA
jgi:hypothetical protein